MTVGSDASGAMSDCGLDNGSSDCPNMTPGITENNPYVIPNAMNSHIDVTPDNNPCTGEMPVIPDIHRSISHEEVDVTSSVKRQDKVFVPKGLEIIPIFKKSESSDSHFPTSQFGNDLGEGSHPRLSLSISFTSGVDENSDSENILPMQIGIEGKGCEGTAEIVNKDVDESGTMSSKSLVKNGADLNVCKSLMDVTTFLSEHFLLTSYSIVNSQEMSQTNVEMLIGQKSEILHYCKLCGLESKDKDSIGQHIDTRHSSRKDFEMSIKCPFCPYKNINKFKLNSHVTSHTMEKPFQCTECDYGTTTRSMLKKHLFTHSDDKPFKCNDCPYASNERYKVRVHSLNQHSAGMKPYRCDSCSYSSADKSTLKRHSLVHSDSKPFSCDTCPYTGNSIHDLRKHEFAHTNIKPFSCHICTYTCNFNSNLQKHIKTHTGERKYKCSDCSFATVSRSKLIKHALKHKGQLPFRCELCAYATAENFYFKQHMNSHNNIREFKCGQCDYAGTSNNNLKRHLLTHSADKPFKCGECDYASKESGKLKRHLKTHNKALPQKCPHCDFKNFNNYNYKKHLLTHTTDSGYVCAVCASVSPSKAKLRVHLKLHEPSDDAADNSSEEENRVRGDENAKSPDQVVST